MKYTQALEHLHRAFMGENDLEIQIVLTDGPGTVYQVGDQLEIVRVSKSPTGIVQVHARRERA